GVVKSLEHDAKRRVEEGLAQVCIAVIYPEALRIQSFDKLKDSLANSTFRIRVFTQASDGEWNSGNTNELSAMLRRAYDGMIKEDVLEAAVQELRSSIEDSAQDLLESKATLRFFGKFSVCQKAPLKRMRRRKKKRERKATDGRGRYESRSHSGTHS